MFSIVPNVCRATYIFYIWGQIIRDIDLHTFTNTVFRQYFFRCFAHSFMNSFSVQWSLLNRIITRITLFILPFSHSPIYTEREIDTTSQYLHIFVKIVLLIICSLIPPHTQHSSWIFSTNASKFTRSSFKYFLSRWVFMSLARPVSSVVRSEYSLSSALHSRHKPIEINYTSYCCLEYMASYCLFVEKFQISIRITIVISKTKWFFIEEFHIQFIFVQTWTGTFALPKRSSDLFILRSP